MVLSTMMIVSPDGGSDKRIGIQAKGTQQIGFGLGACYRATVDCFDCSNVHSDQIDFGTDRGIIG